MKKTILEIYALLICFGAVICLSVNVGMAIYSVIGIKYPEITMGSFQYQIHQNNDNYWQEQSGRFVDELQINDTHSNKKIPRQRPIEAILTQQRLDSYQTQRTVEKRNRLQDIIREIIISIISVLLLIVHWRFMRKI